VTKDYSYTLLNPRDLRDFTGLSTCPLTQRQKIGLGVGWELVRWHLEGMYGTVEEGMDSDGVPILRVGETLHRIFCGDLILIRLWASWISNTQQSMRSL
jgi:cleavage and polyadenylation specificity factor subunit 3